MSQHLIKPSYNNYDTIYASRNFFTRWDNNKIGVIFLIASLDDKHEGRQWSVSEYQEKIMTFMAQPLGNFSVW